MMHTDSRQKACGKRPWWLAAVAASVALATAPLAAQQLHASDRDAPPAAGERRVLYYYDPMHPQYRADKPGTAPDCGMALVPMYAAASDTHAPSPGTVQISPLKQQLTGIRTVPASRGTLVKEIRTVGIVQPDEARVRQVHVKFPGWIDKLFVNRTGQAVHANEPILAIYSPDLVSTQTEYLLAWRGEQQLQGNPFGEAANNSQTLLDAARRRLLLWDITPQQIRTLQETGRAQTSVTLHSPVTGYVTAKEVYEGRYVTPEVPLYTVTDLSRVWLVLDVYEYELPFVHVGTAVDLTLRSQPGRTISAAVSYVYPYLDNQTRTNKVRVELDNPDLRLKPQMYATAVLHAAVEDRLAVPSDAVLDSGTQRVVFVAADGGYFQPRPVHLGERGDGYVEVLDGLRDGERVVVGANFMVDSESQLQAALGAMTQSPSGGQSAGHQGQQH